MKNIVLFFEFVNKIVSETYTICVLMRKYNFMTLKSNNNNNNKRIQMETCVNLTSTFLLGGFKIWIENVYKLQSKK